MSVFYENHDQETEADRPFAANRGPSQTLRRLTARAGQIGGEGMSFERAEGFIHLALAFAIVAGAALILKTAFVPEAPVAKAAKSVEPPPAVARASETPPVPRGADNQPAPPAPAPEASPSASAPAVASSLLSPQPMAPAAPPEAPAIPPETASSAPEPAAAAPEPLAPPPADLRDRLAARTEAPAPAAPAPQEAAASQATVPAEEPGVPVSAPPTKEEPAAPAHEADAGHMAKCFFKLSGKVQNSGPCRVTHAGAAVVLQLPGKPLEIAPVHGRVWTATLGGRSLGKVYKTGACWGAKGFYACEKG